MDSVVVDDYEILRRSRRVRAGRHEVVAELNAKAERG